MSSAASASPVDQTSEVVTFSAATEAELDARLAAAGFAKPRYFLITRYD